ncbi:MAG: hypothetical protein J5629_02395 [Muribaculaceae bacterium]|nr:hypothetical protein [Muribaculaceae bacterium]
MKKIFTLIAAALLSLAVSAQDCPTKTMMNLLNGDDAANVEIEVGISEQSSAYLVGFNFEITKPEGATWKAAYDENYFTAQGYAPYILGCLPENTGQDLTDDELEGYLSRFCDVDSWIRNNDKLVIVEVLKFLICRFFPSYPGNVGKFALDMSALEDGEYEVRAENTADSGYMWYQPGTEANQYWRIDKPMVLTLMKQGETVIQKSSIQATYVQGLTGISTVATDSENADSRIFDLQGRELKSVPEHGIYIQNGKKYVK